MIFHLTVSELYSNIGISWVICKVFLTMVDRQIKREMNQLIEIEEVDIDTGRQKDRSTNLRYSCR